MLITFCVFYFACPLQYRLLNLPHLQTPSQSLLSFSAPIRKQHRLSASGLESITTPKILFKISSVDSIRSAFKHTTIQAFTREPDYKVIKRAHVNLKANVAEITSTLEGGNHDLLRLMMSDANYLLVSGHTFVTSLNPGLLPTVPTNSSTTNTYELVHQHKSSLKTYHKVKPYRSSIKTNNNRNIRRDLH